MGESDELNNSETSEVMEPPQKPPTKKKQYLIKIIPKALLIFLGYGFAYMQWSPILLLIAVGTWVWLETRDTLKANRIAIRAKASSYSKHELVRKIDEIPSWVKFPDRERAEWLNQVIAQLWPTVNNYIVKLFRTSIQNKIRKKYDSFSFEDIDFGCTPPKIDGIKVYKPTASKDSVIIDFDIFYDGNCDINFSLSGAGIGGIRDFQLSVEVRVVLKPLLLKMPLIGGIQIYFLNTPDISFTLDGLTSIPGLSYFIRSKIEEKITKLIVFPNKITKRFSKSVEPSELKSLEPAGVLRVHVFEAKNLMAKDITGKSDPYVVLTLGAQESKTHTINQSLNPKWDHWCEFVVIDPLSQHLGFKLFDHDNVNEDDFLGSGDVDISTVVKGSTDQWFQLDKAKHGTLHLRFTWLSLSSDINVLNAISQETKLLQVDSISTAVLLVYVDMAQKIPEGKQFIKPHPFFVLSIGDRKQKSKVKKHTTDPIWEQGFVFLVTNPQTDSLHLIIFDKQTTLTLTQFSYPLSELLSKPNLQLSKTEFPLEHEDSKITMSLQLKILTNETTPEEDEESETDSEAAFSRQSSISDTDLKSLGSGSLENLPKQEEILHKSIAPLANTLHSQVRRTPSSSSSGEYKLGKLELSLSYSEPRQKLLVTIHQVTNLPIKDPSDIPDPYVKLRLTTEKNTNGHAFRTKVKTDCCSPVYNETFEFLCSKSEAFDHVLVAQVKTKKFFNNNTIGQVEVNLKYVSLSEPYRAWFDLCPKQ